MTSVNSMSSAVSIEPQQNPDSLKEMADGIRNVYDYFVKDPWKLPVILFAWPLFLLSGCSCKTASSENTNPSVDFDQSSNQLAHQLYQGLLNAGVSPASLDVGYQIINYNNTYCPGQGPTCLIGAGDHVIKSEEVFEYALNNSARHRTLIEHTLGDPIPWELDDLNPATSFDAEIRHKITDAIDALKGILAAKGYTEGTDGYKESLAVGAFWIAAFPREGGINTEYLKRRLENLGIDQFVDYLALNGGLGLDLNTFGEYSALEALQNINGDCTENSEVLFSIFRMAGLDPEYVMVKLRVSDADNLDGSEAFRDDSRETIRAMASQNPYFNHVCVGLRLGGRLRLFDTMFIQMDAQYQEYVPINLRHFWSRIYTNRSSCDAGNISGTEGSMSFIEKALLLDPMNVSAMMCTGSMKFFGGDYDQAITTFSQTITIDPYASRAYFFRGISFLKKGEADKGFNDFTSLLRMEPEMRTAVMRGISEYYTALRWENNQDARVFSQETSLDIAKVEALFITCNLLWSINLRELAREELDLIVDTLELSGAPSEFTVDLFEEIFRNMPEDMRVDEQISGMIDSIRQKLRQ